jgi:hypothetical protein
MQHLDEGRLIELVLDGKALSPAEQDHLSLCPECLKEFRELAQLQEELAVARMSEMSPQAERRLFSLFTQIGKENPIQHLLGTLAAWVNALPLWDSRQQAASVAVRNGSRSSYRLLFGAQETEVELMVEPQNGLLYIMGEIMVAETDGTNALALIELMAAADAKSALETESDSRGRFALEKVRPGRYVMTITPRYSPMIVIEPLELT